MQEVAAPPPRPLLRGRKHQLAQACQQYAMKSSRAARLLGQRGKLVTWAAVRARLEVLSRQLVAAALVHCCLSQIGCRWAWLVHSRRAILLHAARDRVGAVMRASLCSHRAARRYGAASCQHPGLRAWQESPPAHHLQRPYRLGTVARLQRQLSPAYHPQIRCQSVVGPCRA